MLCIYYNESETKNKDHPENHDRINISIKHIKENIKNITIYNNNTILNYLQSKLKMESKEEISKLLYNSSDSIIYSDKYMLDIKKKCSKLKDNEIISGDTYFSNVTYNEILDNSIIMYNACYQININKIKYAYCLIRPPSHHSSLNQYSGFCIVNHTYLTAKHLHDMYKKKVLILDYDVHHGDGTQKLVKSHMQDNIYFISMHCYGDGFYPGTGNIDENNMKVLNIPMKKGSKNKEYIHMFDKVKKFIATHDIDIIVVSNGVDAHIDDPFKTMKLTNEFYCYVTSYLKSLDVPLIYILEGGYNPDVIGSVSVDIINTLQTKENVVLRHEWTDEETRTFCEMYKDNMTVQQIYNMLPHIKLNSIKMKYANCLYLDKGNITGALCNASHMHKKIWVETTKIEEQNSSFNVPEEQSSSVSLKDSMSFNVPKIHKSLVWNEYIGIDIGRTKCLCCNMNDINMLNFHMGHVIAKSKGGTMSVDNLRPICSQCNLSMNNEHMIDFMKRLQYDMKRITLTPIKYNTWCKYTNIIISLLVIVIIIMFYIK